MAREDAPTGDFDAKYSIDDAGYEPSPDSIRGDVAEKRAGDNPAEKGAPGDPFGDESNNEVKYRTMEWYHAAVILIAETVSLGILSLPSVLASIGMVPGVILILGLGALATYTGYVIGQFKMRYPHVHNMGDAGEVMLGAFGRELFGAAQTLFLCFNMGSHLLTFKIAMDVITEHATCSIVWGFVGMFVLFVCTLPRTLKKVSYFSLISFLSIGGGVMITMIGVGVERPDPTVQATTAVAFASGFGSVTNIIFAYAGHVAFFSFISELKNPADFPKALWALQITATTLYLVVAIVIYRYAGPNVASPALGSAAPTVSKVAYGIAIPTILLAGMIYAHVGAKYIYVRLYRGTKHMSERTWKSFGSWFIIVLTLWIVAWILAESIPTFNDILGLIAALFASWFTYGLSGVFWLYMRRGEWFSSSKNIALTVLNFCIFGIGAAICGIGLYASGKSIHDNVGNGGSWTCAAST